MENHFGILAAALILLQAWIPYHYQHIDDDDARYVSEEVSAVVHDTLLVDDPITDEYMYWDVGEVRKDVTSPWTMYVAMCCKITGIAPAVFSHTFFPFFMIIICYVLYGMIGNVLFRGDAEKTALFLIVYPCSISGILHQHIHCRRCFYCGSGRERQSWRDLSFHC